MIFNFFEKESVLYLLSNRIIYYDIFGVIEVFDIYYENIFFLKYYLYDGEICCYEIIFLVY